MKNCPAVPLHTMILATGRPVAQGDTQNVAHVLHERYIYPMGTGIRDMIERCRNAGLAEPEFSLTDGFVTTIRRRPERAFEAVGGKTRPESVSATGEVTGEVRKLLMICRDAMTRKRLQEALSLKGEENFRKLYLVPALETGYIEMTIPDKPKSSKQKYRLTAKGRAWLAAHDSKQQEKGKGTP